MRPEAAVLTASDAAPSAPQRKARPTFAGSYGSYLLSFVRLCLLLFVASLSHLGSASHYILGAILILFSIQRLVSSGLALSRVLRNGPHELEQPISQPGAKKQVALRLILPVIGAILTFLGVCAALEVFQLGPLLCMVLVMLCAAFVFVPISIYRLHSIAKWAMAKNEVTALAPLPAATANGESASPSLEASRHWWTQSGLRQDATERLENRTGR